ncbi:hypothetical protein ABBQ32_003873 [Trebouxia sp. C0010 RCD-2024]
MGKEGDKKAFVGSDHGTKAEGSDGRLPTTEKQWRDMPKGARPDKPSEQHEEPKPETQKATGEHKPGNFTKDKSELPADNPEHRVDQSTGQEGPVSSKSGAHTSYDEVVVGQLGGGEKKIADSGSA